MQNLEIIGYFEAWQRWSSGNQIADLYLWGIKILWLGRIGKIIQFISAITIIVEIIGIERIRSTAAKFRRRNTLQSKLNQLKIKFEEYLRDWSYVVSSGKIHIWQLVCFLFKWIPKSCIILLIKFPDLGHELPYLARNCQINAIIWVLERPNVANIIRIVSFILLIVGFHFDFLAS